MKSTTILLGAIASAVLCGTSAMAQINYNNGDLLAGFRNGSSTELVVDLGSIANFQAGLSGGTYSTVFAGVSAAIANTFGSTTGVYWSVFGANDTTVSPNNGSVIQSDANTVWTTLARSNPNTPTLAPHVGGNSASQALAVGSIESIGGIAASATPGVVSLSAGIAALATSLGGYQVNMADPYTGNLGGNWAYNIENLGAGTSDLYQSDPGNQYVKKGVDLGNFTLASNGAFSFSSVPEPSTWAMIGTGALSLLAFRRSNRNQTVNK